MKTRTPQWSKVLGLLTIVCASAAPGVSACAQTRIAKRSPGQAAPQQVTFRQPASAQAAPQLIILVRHAEKATTGGTDPSLSDAGVVRAKALAAAIGDAHVTAIVATTYKRTSETAEPFAKMHGVAIERVGLEGGIAAHVAAVLAAVRKHPGEVVLVVGHSNTVPAIVTAFGGPAIPDLCDASYATMFMVQPSRNGAAPSVVRVKYGAADAEGTESCAVPAR